MLRTKKYHSLIAGFILGLLLTAFEKADEYAKTANIFTTAQLLHEEPFAVQTCLKGTPDGTKCDTATGDTYTLGVTRRIMDAKM